MNQFINFSPDSKDLFLFVFLIMLFNDSNLNVVCIVNMNFLSEKWFSYIIGEIASQTFNYFTEDHTLLTDSS